MLVKFPQSTHVIDPQHHQISSLETCGVYNIFQIQKRNLFVHVGLMESTFVVDLIPSIHSMTDSSYELNLPPLPKKNVSLSIFPYQNHLHPLIFPFFHLNPPFLNIPFTGQNFWKEKGRCKRNRTQSNTINNIRGLHSDWDGSTQNKAQSSSQGKNILCVKSRETYSMQVNLTERYDTIRQPKILKESHSHS